MLFADAVLLGSSQSSAGVLKAVISGSLNNVDLKSWLDSNTSFDTSKEDQTYEITISATIGSTSTSTASFAVASFPANTIINIIGSSLTISGAGGSGAPGATRKPKRFVLVQAAEMLLTLIKT